MMNPLLELGLTHSNQEQLAATDTARSAALLRENRELIDELMKSDSTRMKERLVIIHASRGVDERVAALDDLENLVESLDNSNDFPKFGGIEAMLSLLSNPNESEDIKFYALWVLGTCSQNNSRFTSELLRRQGLPSLLSYIDGTSHSTPKLQSKAIYCLFGCTMSSPDALQQFEICNGFSVILEFLVNPQDIDVSRKIAFLFLTLLNQYGHSPDVIKALSEAKLFRKLLTVLDIYDDLDIREKVFEIYEAAAHVHDLKVVLEKDKIGISLTNWIMHQAPAPHKEGFTAILKRFTQ